jgi:hypothetical protein
MLIESCVFADEGEEMIHTGLKGEDGMVNEILNFQFDVIWW